jgi:hypothetical protein
VRYSGSGYGLFLLVLTKHSIHKHRNLAVGLLKSSAVVGSWSNASIALWLLFDFADLFYSWEFQRSDTVQNEPNHAPILFEWCRKLNPLWLRNSMQPAQPKTEAAPKPAPAAKKSACCVIV